MVQIEQHVISTGCCIVFLHLYVIVSTDVGISVYKVSQVRTIVFWLFSEAIVEFTLSSIFEPVSDPMTSSRTDGVGVTDVSRRVLVDTIWKVIGGKYTSKKGCQVCESIDHLLKLTAIHCFQLQHTHVSGLVYQ